MVGLRQIDGQPPKSLAALARDAKECRRCSLWANATQTVFGEGTRTAAVVLVGEQPGDVEDLAGRPFVGPAGRLLDRALEDAGVDRGKLYVTNAVKHFKNEPRGKRRLHKTPDRREIDICRWWLDRELALIAPELTVALGASAARALAGRSMPINANRGRKLTFRPDLAGLVTVHPSYLLRLSKPEDRTREYARFVSDLRTILDIAPRAAA